jgi:hypothetical protein
MMRGYLAFVLVFVSMALVLALLSMVAAAGPRSLSRAISVERAYGVQMNAKESALGISRQLGRKGFDIYRMTHFPQMCGHCLDHFCIPSPLPAPLLGNSCSEQLCSLCFREDGARAYAEAGAAMGLASLNSGGVFDRDFSVSIDGGLPEAFLAPDPVMEGSYILDSMRFRVPLRIRVESDKLGISSDSSIPAGTVVRCG